MKQIYEIKATRRRALCIAILAIILLVVSGFAGNVNADAENSDDSSCIAVGDHIYLGTMDSPSYIGLPYWRVIDIDNEGNLFLLSEYLWKETGGIDNGLIKYNSDTSYRFWPGSHAQEWCVTFDNQILEGYPGFTVKGTTKSDATYVSPDFGSIQFLEYENILNNDKVFLLSAEEAATYMPEKSDRIAYLHDGTSKGKADSWWLRSARDYPNAICTGKIVSNGEIDRDIVNHLAAVRPAFWCSIPTTSKAVKYTNADGNVWFIGADADNFEEPEYIWSDDNASCTAQITNIKYKETVAETVTTTSIVVKEATESQEGLKVYTASFNGAHFGEKTNQIVIPKKTHVVRNGSKVTVNGSTFKVLSTNSKTVSLVKAKNVKSYTVPATVKIANKTYKVITVESKALTASRIRTVTIGKNVKTLKKYSFSKCKAKTVIVKSKLLKKAAVKGSLKGSKVSTVKVSVGSKSVNKKYVKAYKKIFTKANAGRKVTVK